MDAAIERSGTQVRKVHHVKGEREDEGPNDDEDVEIFEDGDDKMAKSTFRMEVVFRNEAEKCWKEN